jgi:hypothetical protein
MAVGPPGMEAAADRFAQARAYASVATRFAQG